MKLASVQAISKALDSAGVRFLVAGGLAIVPITAEQFADATLRSTLVREKGMQVLQLFSDQNRETSIDIFAEVPFSFEEEYARATIRELAGAGEVRFVSIDTLIRMKEAAGRPTDQIDVEHFRMRLQDDEQAT